MQIFFYHSYIAIECFHINILILTGSGPCNTETSCVIQFSAGYDNRLFKIGHSTLCTHILIQLDDIYSFLLGMIFGNFIPLVLANKYPEIVAIGYPLVIFGISMITAFYVLCQIKKTGITAIDPDMLNKKEKKQLRYPGLKAGLIYGLIMLFGIPLLNVLTDDSKSYLSSLLNTRHFVTTIVVALFFGVTMQSGVALRIQKAKKDQDDD